MRTRLSFKDNANNIKIIFKIEPKNINRSIIDNSSIEAMKEKLSQTIIRKGWEL